MSASYLFNSEKDAEFIHNSMLRYGVSVTRFCATLQFESDFDEDYFRYHYLCKMIPDRRPKKIS